MKTLILTKYYTIHFVIRVAPVATKSPSLCSCPELMRGEVQHPVFSLVNPRLARVAQPWELLSLLPPGQDVLEGDFLLLVLPGGV